jgi:regulator of RNase E activity RraB
MMPAYGQEPTLASPINPFVCLTRRAHHYMKLLRLLGCATLAIASFSPFTVAAQTSIAEQQDARVIDNLRHNGADVTKVHDIDFFLVFSSQSDATATAEKIRVLGYEVVGVKQVSAAKQWEVHAKRKMVPELGAMQASTRALQTLAEARGGYYDGWGTVGIK